MTALQVSDAQAQSLAREIVHRSEFASWREVDLSSLPLPSLLREWLSWLMETTRSLASVSPVLYWTTVYGLAAVTLLLIAHLVWSLRVAMKGGAGDLGDSPNPAGIDFVALAGDLAIAGRFLDAAHTMQLACIEHLLRRRWIQLSRSEPNRTLRRRLGKSAVPVAERESLVQLLDQTETAWFRDRSQDPALYEGWRRMYSRLCEIRAAST